MVSINDFMQNFKGGGARADKFRAHVTYPSAVTTPSVQDYIVISTAELPGSTVSPTFVFFQGRQIPLFGDRQLEPFTMTILNDIDFGHRNAFETWLNAIQSHESNIQSDPNYQNLLGVVQIDQLDRNDNILKTIKLMNAFPNMMSPIMLDYGATDQVEVYSISMSYSHWTSTLTT